MGHTKKIFKKQLLNFKFSSVHIEIISRKTYFDNQSAVQISYKINYIYEKSPVRIKGYSVI